MSTSGRQYRIIQQIGKGGFGTVYRAELQGVGGFAKQVALKVLNRGGDGGDAALNELALRLRDEARILGLIQHRAIVRVDSLARLGDGWAVVMEYVPGVDLHLVVRKAAPPARVALQLIEEVASALYAAFSVPSDVTDRPLRLLHRDIKPSNIRITAQGEVKVLDFGVARAEFQEREARTRSVLMGSFRYMAPERIEGIEGPAADIYSLGLVLAELLCGKVRDAPPKHPSRHEVFIEEIRNDIQSRHRKVWKAQREAIVSLVERMLSFEPSDRPTAREVERTCREIAGQLTGAWLREWSEEEIPTLQSMVVMKDDPLEGSVLVEGGDITTVGLDEPDERIFSTATPAPGRSARPADQEEDEEEDATVQPAGIRAELPGAVGFSKALATTTPPSETQPPSERQPPPKVQPPPKATPPAARLKVEAPPKGGRGREAGARPSSGASDTPVEIESIGEQKTRINQSPEALGDKKTLIRQFFSTDLPDGAAGDQPEVARLDSGTPVFGGTATPIFLSPRELDAEVTPVLGVQHQGSATPAHSSGDEVTPLFLSPSDAGGAPTPIFAEARSTVDPDAVDPDATVAPIAHRDNATPIFSSRSSASVQRPPPRPTQSKPKPAVPAPPARASSRGISTATAILVVGLAGVAVGGLALILWIALHQPVPDNEWTRGEPPTPAAPVSPPPAPVLLVPEPEVPEPVVPEPVVPEPVAPDPVVAVAPVQPRPRAVPRRTPAVWVELAGGADQIQLIAAGGRSYKPGWVPAGTYDIHAAFDGAELVAAGRVELSEGERTRLKCTSVMVRCTKQP